MRSRLDKEAGIVLHRCMFASREEVLQTITSPGASEERRVSACSVAGQLRNHDALGPLLTAVRDSSERISFAAGNAISAIKSRKATRELIRVVRSGPDEHNRYAAICALFGVPDRRARPILLTVVNNNDGTPETRALAAEVLGQLPSTPRSVDSLAKALRNANPAVRFGALCGIGGFASLPTGDLESAVAELLNDDSPGSGRETIGQRALLVLESFQRLRKLRGKS